MTSPARTIFRAVRPQPSETVLGGGGARTVAPETIGTRRPGRQFWLGFMWGTVFICCVVALTQLAVAL